MKKVFSLLVLVVLACASDDPAAPQLPDPDEPPVSGSGFSLLTFLHGNDNNAQEVTRDVAVDADGNVYVTGGTADRGFPTTDGAYQRTFGQGKPSTSTGSHGNWDVFVMKFAPDGQLVWSTLLGGGNHDRAFAIEVDRSGVYVAGRAGEGFPTTGGVVQPNFAGDDRPSGSDGKQDGFIAKLSLDGSTLLWSTFFGGPADEFIRDLAVDANGDLYPAMASVKQVFPYVQAGSFQSTNRGAEDGVACRLSAGATSVRWCSFIGGSARDGWNPSVRLDGAGNLYYLQSTRSTNMPTTIGAYQSTHGGDLDLHLSKWSPNGTLLFATFFGGRGEEDMETHNLWVTASGEAYMATATTSPDLPTTNGAYQASHGGGYDGFIARLSADGTQLLACTYIGGGAHDRIEGIGADASGNIVVTGSIGGALTLPSSYPQAVSAGGQDGFIATFPSNLTRISRATFLGGKALDAGRALAVDGPRNIVYVGGDTNSNDFPTLEAAFQKSYSGGDGFLAGWRN